MEGSSGKLAKVIIIAGMLLSQVATPIRARAVGSERTSLAHDQGGVVSVSQAVEHRSCALGASVARIAHAERQKERLPIL